MVVRLIGPGGGGKSSTGLILAERLGVSFVDLDQYFIKRAGDISAFIGKYGYGEYARENVEAYCSLLREQNGPGVVAFSSGFMTYERNVHSEYVYVRSEVQNCSTTFALLPSLDLEVCVAETVRRQIARPFGRSASREEAVIRERFEVYSGLGVRRVETMRPVGAVVDELMSLLPGNRNQ